MNKPLKVAVLGTGTMGKVHADAWSRIAEAQLVAMTSLDREETQRLADRYGAQAYDSVDDILAAPDVDVVDVCLPTYLHKPLIEQAARAGKHVISEKPLGLNVQEATEIIDTCKQYGVQLYVAHVVRFFPEYVQAHEQVKNGAVGKSGVVNMTRGGHFPRGWENWYADKEKSGGLILDMIIHDFDWLRWTFGDVCRVMARCQSRLTGDDPLEYALVTLRMADGTIAHVEGSWAHAMFRTTFEIAGADGMLEHDSRTSTPLTVSQRGAKVAAAQGVAVPESPLAEGPYERELRHFAECLLTGSEPIVTAYDALKAVEIAQAALKSAETGEVVTLKAEAEEVN